MEQAFDYRLSRELLQVIAGLTKANAANLDLANKEFLSDQVIQGNIACDQIPPRSARSKLDKVISAERLDGFSLDQSQLMRRLGFEESALPQRVAVALKERAAARRAYLSADHQRRARRHSQPAAPTSARARGREAPHPARAQSSRFYSAPPGLAAPPPPPPHDPARPGARGCRSART